MILSPVCPPATIRGCSLILGLVVNDYLSEHSSVMWDPPSQMVNITRLVITTQHWAASNGSPAQPGFWSYSYPPPPLVIIVKHSFWSTESAFDAGISENHHFTSITTNSRSVVLCSSGIGWMCHYVCGPWLKLSDHLGNGQPIASWK